MDDPLGFALRNARNLPSNASGNRGNHRAKRNVNFESNQNINQQQQLRNKKVAQNKKKKVPKCSFCNDNQAVVLIKNTLTTKAYCLFHYYTSKAGRVPSEKVEFIQNDDTNELNTQLPYVQELFTKAFTELQQDISLESTKSFQSMVARGTDPLSILTDHNTKKRSQHSSSLLKESTKKMDTGNDGGFIRQVQAKERVLMEEQSQRIQKAANESVQHLITNQTNVFKRRKTSSKSSWHLVFDKKTNVEMKKIDQNYLDDNAEGISCNACGSNQVKLCGGTQSRSNAASKADTWGFKRENDVSTRYTCINCNTSWNEQY